MKRLIGLLVMGLTFVSLAVAQNAGDYYHRHHSSSVEKVNYDSLFAGAVDVNDSKRGQELIRACISRYGGTEKLESLKSCRLKYDMSPTISKGAVDVIKTFSENRHYHIMRHGSNGVERRILNGNLSWQDRSDTVIQGSPARYKSELFSFLTARLPLTMTSERFSQIKYGKRENDSLEYIYMLKSDSLMIIAGIDPSDSMIRTSEGVIYDDSSSFVFKNIFTDFQEYDGFIFPRGLTNISMGLMVAQSTLVRVDINPQFGPKEFQPVDRQGGQSIHR